VVKKIRLPKRYRHIKSPLRILRCPFFPLANEELQCALVSSRYAEKMNVVRHHDIPANNPAVQLLGVSPDLAANLMHLSIRENGFAIERTRRNVVDRVCNEDFIKSMKMLVHEPPIAGLCDADP
jgi:hypothetical protein